VPHYAHAEQLRQVLEAWIERTGKAAYAARNLAIRFIEERPQIGIDPDVCLLDPPPPEVERLTSLRLWEPGHVVPPFCVEVVSHNHPHKDYSTIQERYAAIGTRELVVFDPLLAGPSSLGGPVLLQFWQRDPEGVLTRTAFGFDPVYSNVLGAWLLPSERELAIADDRDGEHVWLSTAELSKRRAGREQRRAEQERARRLALERRVAELEASKGSSGS
jgi:hypothetical protein